MSAWGGIGPGTRVLILVLGGALLAGAGYLGWQAAQPVAPKPAATEEAAVAAAPAPASAAAPAAPTEGAGARAARPEPPPAPALPGIDTWRVAADGEALVAGLASPGAAVEVLVDDRTVAEGVALASGEFVLQFTLAPNPEPSLMWLAMTPPDGARVVSPELVALAPIAGPELARAEPEALPGPAPGSASTPPPAPLPVPEAAGKPEPDATAAAEPEAAPAAGPTAAPAALLVTGEGAVVLQDRAGLEPDLAGQVLIDTIAYTPAGTVQVGGRGDAGSALRVYLDNAEIAVASVAGDGRWLATLGDGAPGVYTLRVDQVDAAGKVTSRFETPFKRETPEALALVAGVGGAVEAAPAEPSAPEPQAQDAAATATAAEPATAEVAPARAPEPDTASAGNGPAPAPVPPEAAAEAVRTAAAVPTVTITVQPGFTLWGIAQERMGDGMFFVQVFEANRDRIKNPDLIYPGQVFTIPAGGAP